MDPVRLTYPGETGHVRAGTLQPVDSAGPPRDGEREWP
jgi:hypothetical protein